MNGSTKTHIILALAVVVAVLTAGGGARRAVAQETRGLFPNVIGTYEGTFQGLGNPDTRGLVMMTIASQSGGRFLGFLVIAFQEENEHDCDCEATGKVTGR